MTRDEINDRVRRDGWSGFLMRNTRKDAKSPDEAEQRKPDYTGRLHCGGVLWMVSAWLKISNDGRKYLSLATELAAGQDLAPYALQREAEDRSNGQTAATDDGGLPF